MTPAPHSRDDQPGAQPSTLRIMTLNLWGRYGAWSERRGVLAAELAALRPDLIAFQEAIKDRSYDQLVDLLSAEYHIVHAGGRTPDGSGGSLASRWPIGAVYEADLQPAPASVSVAWESRALAAEIAVPGLNRPLLMVNYPTAWQYGQELAREQQAAAAARFVAEIVGGRHLHVVLAGDFNAAPEAASMRFWRGEQSLEHLSVCYTDSWARMRPDEPGHTFTARNPLVAQGDFPLERGRRIDYVLVRCDDYGPTLAVAACRLAFDTAHHGVWASDHFGVVADLAVPPEDTATAAS